MKNIKLQSLIKDLKKKSIDEKAPIWKRIAVDLEKPSRKRRIINLEKLDKVTNDGDFIIVPGKLLGNGEFTKKATIAAFQFSQSAKTKLSSAKSNILNIDELLKKDPKGQKVRIIG